MNAPARARRRATLALLGAAALGAGCATREAATAARAAAPGAQVRLGDRWRYASINLYNGMRLGELLAEVVATTPRLRVAVSATTGAAGGQRSEEVYASAWRVLEEPNYDLAQVFSAPAPLLPSVLAPGASESFRGSYRTPLSDDALYWSEIARVETWERVRVPAGEFLALRVRRTIAFDHADRFRQRNTRSDTLWYAPEVNRWVRREWTGWYGTAATLRTNMREDWVAHELIDYRPG
ncbi:MAG: hypothetical protein KJZ83_13585 [Burkholderiaceae bacterium]|nr:hypothetical protein [Burkholderiaceae bacterium]